MDPTSNPAPTATAVVGSLSIADVTGILMLVIALLQVFVGFLLHTKITTGNAQVDKVVNGVLELSQSVSSIVAAGSSANSTSSGNGATTAANPVNAVSGLRDTSVVVPNPSGVGALPNPAVPSVTAAVGAANTNV